MCDRRKHSQNYIGIARRKNMVKVELSAEMDAEDYAVGGRKILKDFLAGCSKYDLRLDNKPVVIND
jgi:hypothetical protein